MTSEGSMTLIADPCRQIERLDDVECERQALLAGHTSFQIGGPADLLVIPRTLAALVAVLGIVRRAELPLLIIGAGTNLLIADDGFRGVALKIAAGLSPVLIDGDRLEADAGRSLPELSRRAGRAGLAGLEFAAGIPGTLGGALAVNAGAAGQEIGGLATRISGVDLAGELIEVDAREVNWSYRQASFPEPLVITAARLTLTPAPAAEIAARAAEWHDMRRQRQPLGQLSAGCVFRNPPGAAAGHLIDSAGLKGARVGAAVVSTSHANFIINQGGATAAEVLQLIEQVRTRVQALHGIELRLEIQLAGGQAEFCNQREADSSCEPPIGE